MPFPGAISDPKVRRKLRQEEMPELLVVLTMAGKQYVADESHDLKVLEDVRDALRWQMAQTAQRSRVMSEGDWEIQFAWTCAIIAGLVDKLRTLSAIMFSYDKENDT